MDLELFTKEERFERARAMLSSLNPVRQSAQDELTRLRESRGDVIEQLVAERAQAIRGEVEQYVSNKEADLTAQYNRVNDEITRLEQLKAENAPVEVIG